MTSGGVVPVTGLTHPRKLSHTRCMLTVPVTGLLVSFAIRRRMRFRSRLSLLARRSCSGALPLRRTSRHPVVVMTKRRLNGSSRMDSVLGSLSSLLQTVGARFRSLDMKLSTSLGKIHKAANNALTIDVALLEQQMAEKGAYNIYMYFQSNPIMDFTFRVTDLTGLPWGGDH
eukprot:7181145-Heterocapsa_arctica.AAC.1